jgi:hypothetical protein
MSMRAIWLATWCVAVVTAGSQPPARADDAVLTSPRSADAVGDRARTEEIDTSWACSIPLEATSGLDGTMVEAGAYALAAWITESRRAALRDGVAALPPGIRSQLEGFVPDDILDVVRWRVGGSSQLALQTHLSRLGLVAVTLADVVVFSDEETALNDAGLWAHELRHVMQYRACGITEFARSYVRHHDRLEEDARAYALRWHRWFLQREQASAARAVN